MGILKDGSSEVGSTSVLQGAGGGCLLRIQGRVPGWRSWPAWENSPRRGRACQQLWLQRGPKENERTLGFTDSQDAVSGVQKEPDWQMDVPWMGFHTILFFFLTAQGRNG